MKQKSAPTESLTLWQLAEREAHAETEPVTPPLAAEFERLSELMDARTKVIEHREISGENLEVTPNTRFLSLVKRAKSGDGPSVETGDTHSTTLLDDHANIPGSLIAQAHRVEGSPELYLTLASHDKTRFRQYTVHDGLVTDVSDNDKELSDDEIATVKAAFQAMSEKIEASFEAVDRQRISRKIGAWWADSDGRRAERRRQRAADRQLMRQIRAMGPD